jgi:isoquinoline 1-oxidoreductase beta subunit
VKTVEAVYEAPYLAHACMEPMNATAHVEADKCTVWVPTQYQAGGGAGVLEVAAKIAGVPVEKVTVHTTLLGGGFGRRFNQDFVEDAVEASKAAGAPVKVVYSREDDIAHDFYRPISTVRLTAQLDANGAPIVWQARVASPPTMPPAKGQIDAAAVEGFANLPYAIPNILVDAHNPDLGVPCGFWRSVGSSQNGFFVEGFMDELAAAAGKDPVEYRLALLEKSPRHKRVLEMAAEKSGWGTPLPAGRARGVAMVESFGTFVAEVAEVSIEKGFPRVHRVVVVMDCGPVVNPDIVAAQVEGAIVMGLSAALYEEITIDGGKAVQTNFDSYRLLGLREMPVVEVHLVPSTEPVTGVGEPATPPIAPAVVNAIAVLTGKRIRRLPLTREFPLA